MHRILAIATITAALVAAPVLAQDAAAPDTTPRTSLQKGAWSLSFDIPSFGSTAGGGAFGGWKMVGERTNLGLVLGIQAHDRDESTNGVERDHGSTEVGLGLHARRYAGTIRDVTPFLAAGVNAHAVRATHRTGEASFETWGYGAGAQAGVGVEWFPVRRMSLAGHTGAQVGFYRWDEELDSPAGPRDSDLQSLTFGTFTSRLSLQIYF